MKLWGVFHTNESGAINHTPRVICDCRETAEKARKRFPRCVVAPYQPEEVLEAPVVKQEHSSPGSG